MQCPKCQHVSPDNALNCRECGTVLSMDRAGSHTTTEEMPDGEKGFGVLFANRYRIIEELGQGGMGSVKKAFDTKTQEIVALKILRPEIALDDTAIERFKNELRLTRKISQRHICRMYDLGEEEGTYYIAMEYVSGQSLESRIVSSGELTIEKALFTAKQICEGLAEAHRLGIIHRDLKPQNVMLDREGDVRIVDFGIALSLQSKGMTSPGTIIGSAEYMSPEQLDGREIDHRSDIYSFGVVLFEMVAGRPPFQGESIFDIALRHKSEHPPQPTEFNTRIPDDLNQLIMKCLEKRENDRYQTIEGVLSDLKRIEQNIPISEERDVWKKTASLKGVTGRFAGRELTVVAATVIIMIMVALIVFRDRGADVLADRVVVLLFENKTGDDSLDKIGSIAADWITQGLSQTGIVSVVPVPFISTSDQVPEGVGQMRILSENTGARIIVSGSYYLLDETLQFHANITDAREREIISAIGPVNGSVSDPLQSIELLRQRILGALATIHDPRFATFADVGCQPPTYKSYKEYILGLELFLRREFSKSIDHFARAETLDTTFPQPLIFAAAAYLNQGEYERAAEFSHKVEVLNDKLGPVDKNLHHWLQAVLTGDKERALRAIRTVAHLTSGAFDYQVGLDAMRNNRPQEAVDILTKLDPEGIWLEGWCPYWDILTHAYHMLSNHNQELEEAKNARREYPGESLALWIEARALAALGMIKEIDELLDECMTLPYEQGLNPGRIMILTGWELREHGQNEASHIVFKRALAWYEEQANKVQENKDHRMEVAIVLYSLERWEEARSLLEVILEEKPDDVDIMGYLGMIAARQGEREEAWGISDQLAKIRKPYLFGQHTYYRACIHALVGERENAMKLIRESLTQGVAYTQLHADINLEPLRDYRHFQELVRAKE